MKIQILIVLLLGTVVMSTPASAEKIKQWIAPPECVTDYGLPTQEVLSEEECYKLLNPPGQSDQPEESNTQKTESWIGSSDSKANTDYSGPFNTNKSLLHDYTYEELVLTKPRRLKVEDSTHAQDIRSIVLITLITSTYITLLYTIRRMAARRPSKS